MSESLRNAINAYQTSTGTDILKDYTVADSMFGMLYIFSANIENIISHIDFKLIDESPYLALDKKKLPQDMVKIFEDWENLVKTLEDTPEKLEHLQPQIESLEEEAKEFPAKAENIVSNNNAGVIESARIMKKVGSNVSKIIKARTVLNSISNDTKMILKSIQQFCSTVEENFPNIEDIGKNARKEKILQPRKVIIRFWPDQLRVDQEAVKKLEEKEKAEETKASE